MAHSHFIKGNFNDLQKNYAGKTVTFHIDDYNTRKYRLRNPFDLKISVLKAEDVFSANKHQVHFNVDCTFRTQLNNFNFGKKISLL